MHTHTCVNYRIWGLWANGAAVTAGYICDGFWVSIRRSSSSPASLRSWLQARHADAHAYTLTTARPAEAETCDWSSTYWPDVNRVRRITNWREPNSSAAQSLLHYIAMLYWLVLLLAGLWSAILICFDWLCFGFGGLIRLLPPSCISFSELKSLNKAFS